MVGLDFGLVLGILEVPWGKAAIGRGEGREGFASRGDLDVFSGADGRVEARHSLFTCRDRKRWGRIFSWVDVVLVGETAFLNAPKVRSACSGRSWKKILLLLMVLLPSPQQRKTENSFFRVWFWVLQWCQSASLEWKSSLFFPEKGSFLPSDFFS